VRIINRRVAELIHRHDFVFPNIHSCLIFAFTADIQTSIQVLFKPISATHLNYELQWKEIQQAWETAGSAVVTSEGGKKRSTEAAPLNPGTSYCLRLVYVDEKGVKAAPGPELIIDTEQVGCTPKAESGCGCVVQ